MNLQLQSAVGVLMLTFVAWCLSERRREVNFRIMLSALAVQFALALLLTRLPFSTDLLLKVNTFVLGLDQATRAGTSFVFGYLGGGPAPFVDSKAGSSFILAFRALPLIIVLSALTALLTHWRILPALIEVIAKLLRRVLPLSGATAFACVANIFIGMVESPLFIKAYLDDLKRSELFILMSVGMSTIAGTVLVIYVGFLTPVISNAAGHLIVASIISIPAAIGVAYCMVPDSGGPPNPHAKVNFEKLYQSSMDAVVVGTQQGLRLCLQIAALLIVFVSMVALMNLVLAGIFPAISDEPITLERIVGLFMAPLAWLIGIPLAEVHAAGKLLGIKLVLNEFIAFHSLGNLAADTLSDRSRLIMSYALCGFANIGSLGILIGGLSTMAPARRSEIIELAPKAMVSGTLATLLTGSIIGTIN